MLTLDNLHQYITPETLELIKPHIDTKQQWFITRPLLSDISPSLVKRVEREITESLENGLLKIEPHWVKDDLEQKLKYGPVDPITYVKETLDQLVDGLNYTPVEDREAVGAEIIKLVDEVQGDLDLNVFNRVREFLNGPFTITLSSREGIYIIVSREDFYIDNLKVDPARYASIIYDMVENCSSYSVDCAILSHYNNEYEEIGVTDCDFDFDGYDKIVLVIKE